MEGSIFNSKCQIHLFYCEAMEGRADRLSAFFADNVCGQMKFLEARSQQSEQQINLHNFCESLRLNGEPLKIWVSNHKISIKD
jgi:hypothetical protein